MERGARTGGGEAGVFGRGGDSSQSAELDSRLRGNDGARGVGGGVRSHRRPAAGAEMGGVQPESTDRGGGKTRRIQRETGQVVGVWAEKCRACGRKTGVGHVIMPGADNRDR